MNVNRIQALAVYVTNILKIPLTENVIAKPKKKQNNCMKQNESTIYSLI